MLGDIARMVEDFERGRLTRRQLVVALMGLLGAAPAVRGSPEEASSTFKATELNHIALSVTDIARSRAFYEKHLGLTLMSDGGESRAFLRCGNHFVALFGAGDRQPGLHHYCYSIKNYDPAAAVKTLKAAGLKPDRRSNRVYFDDPDGIEVQVAAPNG